MTLPSIVIVLLGSGPVGCCFLFWKRRNAILAGGIAGLRLLRLLFAVLFLWKLWRCNPFRSALCELNAEFIGNVIDCPLWRVSLFACKVRTVPSVHCGRILGKNRGLIFIRSVPIHVLNVIRAQVEVRWGLILPNSSCVSLLTYKALVCVRYPEFVSKTERGFQVGHFVAHQTTMDHGGFRAVLCDVP